MSDLHETHICRDCGAEITLPYAKPSDLRAAVEGLPFDDHPWVDTVARSAVLALIPEGSVLVTEAELAEALTDHQADINEEHGFPGGESDGPYNTAGSHEDWDL